MSEGAHIAVKKSERDKLLERSFDMAAKEFPWIEELRDRSITEIEMRMVHARLLTLKFVCCQAIAYTVCSFSCNCNQSFV